MQMHWMFNCQKVSEKVSESMDHKLPLLERMMISIHFFLCVYCKRIAKQMKFIRRAARSQGPGNLESDAPAGLSEEAKQRLKLALKNP